MISISDIDINKQSSEKLIVSTGFPTELNVMLIVLGIFNWNVLFVF